MNFYRFILAETTTSQPISQDKIMDMLHHDTFKIVLLALVEVGIAWILSNLIKRWFTRIAAKSLNKGVMTFFGSFASIAIKAVGIIIALDQLGVSMNVIIGTMSGLGVGVALALKNNMASVASGLQILLTKPFKVGDYISIAPYSGTVSSIELTFTTLITDDNQQVVIPNNNFLTTNMVNYTAKPTLRCILDFPCAPGEIQYYLDRLALCAIDCPNVLKSPQPVARVDHYEIGGVADLKLIYYCDTKNYWTAYDEVSRAVSGLFKQSIPKTAPESKESEPELPKDIIPASIPAPIEKTEIQKEEGKPVKQGFRQDLKQIISDVLPIPLPNLPAQKPLKATLSQLFKNTKADQQQGQEMIDETIAGTDEDQQPQASKTAAPAENSIQAEAGQTPVASKTAKKTGNAQSQPQADASQPAAADSKSDSETPETQKNRT